jgi:hypothetical protein
MGAATVPIASALLGAGSTVYAASRQARAAREQAAAQERAAREQVAAQERAAKIQASAARNMSAMPEEVNTTGMARAAAAAERRRRLYGLGARTTRTGAMQTAETGKTKLGE